MKNTINVSNNVNLILRASRCLFFQTVTEKLRCCSKAFSTAWKWKGSPSEICSAALLEIHKP